MSVNDASRIVIDDSRVMLQIVASLTDNSRGIIYYCYMFIVQNTDYRRLDLVDLGMPVRIQVIGLLNHYMSNPSYESPHSQGT
jgi:hypothetical protein